MGADMVVFRELFLTLSWGLGSGQIFGGLRIAQEAPGLD